MWQWGGWQFLLKIIFSEAKITRILISCIGHCMKITAYTKYLCFTVKDCMVMVTLKIFNGIETS